jgi:hypothetical protein
MTVPRKPTGQPAGRRTRTPDGTLADHSLRIKLTAGEHELLRQRAKAAGCKSVADYVRARCLAD